MRRSDVMLTAMVGAYYAAEYGGWYVFNAFLFVVFGSFSIMGFMLAGDGGVTGIMFATVAGMFGGAAYCVRDRALRHKAQEDSREYGVYGNEPAVGNRFDRREPRFTR